MPRCAVALGPLARDWAGLEWLGALAGLHRLTHTGAVPVSLVPDITDVLPSPGRPCPLLCPSSTEAKFKREKKKTCFLRKCALPFVLKTLFLPLDSFPKVNYV